MPGTTTPKQTRKFGTASAAHQPFSWIHPAAKDCPRADFVALTESVSLCSMAPPEKDFVLRRQQHEL